MNSIQQRRKQTQTFNYAIPNFTSEFFFKKNSLVMFRSQASSSCYNLWVLDPRTQKNFKHLKHLVELHMLFEFSDTLNPLSQKLDKSHACSCMPASHSTTTNSSSSSFWTIWATAGIQILISFDRPEEPQVSCGGCPVIKEEAQIGYHVLLLLLPLFCWRADKKKRSSSADDPLMYVKVLGFQFATKRKR